MSVPGAYFGRVSAQEPIGDEENLIVLPYLLVRGPIAVTKNQLMHVMSFSEKQEQAIDEHTQRYSLDECPVCKESSWERHPDLGAICSQHGSGVNVYKTLQLVNQICENCGYVVSFSAEKIGVGMDITLKTNK